MRSGHCSWERVVLGALVASVVCQTSCALFYDFTGEGGATSSTVGSTTDASVVVATASSSTGPWCKDERCFGAPCMSDDTCGERTVDLAAPGQRIHIYGAGPDPSVAVVMWDHDNPGSQIVVRLVSPTVDDEDVPIPTSGEPEEGFGFVAHDAQQVLLGIKKPVPQIALYLRAPQSEVTTYSLDADLPGWVPGEALNQAQPVGAGWVGVLGGDLLRIDPDDGEPLTRVVTIGHGPGHGLVPLSKDEMAFSFYGDGVDGAVGVVRNASGVWSVAAETADFHVLGVATDGTEIFYRAQAPDPAKDLVRAWNPITGATRTITTLEPISAQGIAVDGTSVYFDGATDPMSARALYRCPKALSNQNVAGCEMLASGPGYIGGMSSARLKAGIDEHWLVCYAFDMTLHCRVSR